MRIKKAKLKANSIGMGVLFGVTASLIASIIGVAVTAFLVTSETIGQEPAEYITTGLLTISTTLGSFIACVSNAERKPLVCILTGAGYATVLCLLNVSLFGGKFKGIGLTVCAIMIGVILAILPGLRKNRKGKLHIIHGYR